MLPTTAQHRLYRHVPGNEDLPPDQRRSLDLDYYTPTGEYIHAEPTLDVFWANEDYTPRYPCVSLDLSPTSLRQRGTETLSAFVRKLARPNDPTIAYERLEGEPLYDVLTVQVAVRDPYHPGVPNTHPSAHIKPGEFAKELAQTLWMDLRFQTDYLNVPGVTADGSPLFGPDAHVDADDWAQAMVIEPEPGSGVTANHGRVDDQHVWRYAMQFRVSYTLTHSVLVEAVEALDYTVYVDGEPVTRERTAIGDPVISRSVVPDVPSPN